MDPEIIIKLLPPTISLIFTALFGVVVGILVEKFKNRHRTLEYSVRSQKIIPPLSQNLGGQLSIKLNDAVFDNLKVTTVEIENANSIDLENVVVSFSLSPNSMFQGNDAFLTKIYAPLLWTRVYSDGFKDVLDEYNSCKTDPKNGLKIIPSDLPRKIDFVLSNREYLIPIFNRKDKAVFNFLIADPTDGTDGNIFPLIIHKSVNFIKKADVERQKQKDLWIGIVLGIIFTTILITFLVIKHPDQKCLIIWSGVIGFSYSIVGYLILNGFRKIRMFFK